jgi:hypothetical protein
MPRPIVKISQTVENITATITDPTQKVVLVGPKYDARVYDPAAVDKSSSLVIEDYAPFTGSNLANFTLGANAPEYDIAIDGSVDETHHTPRFYMEDASFSVVHGFKTAVSCVTDNAAGLTAAKSASFRDLYLANKSAWESFITHETSPFQVQAGDTIHLGHNIASKFAYSDELAAGDAALIAAAGTVFSLDIAAVSAAVTVLRWDTQNKFVYLHSAAVAAASANDAATLTITGGSTLTGVLSIPEDQQTIVKTVSSNKLTLASIIHSYPLSTAANLISFRVDRKVSAEFPGVTHIEVSSYNVTNNAGDVNTAARTFDFTFADSIPEITVVNAPDLRDTSIPGIRQIIAADDVSHVITSGDVYSTFRAFVSTGSSLLQSINSNNRVAVAGVAHEVNPLGLAAQVALSNVGSGSISTLNVPEDTAAGYLSALSILAGDPDVYAMVPLSTDFNNVILPYVNEADRLSTPDHSKFRIVIGASEPCPTRDFLVGSPKNPATGNLFTFDQSTLVLLDEQASFVTSGVSTTDKIVYEGTEYSIAAVLDESRVTVLSEGNATLAAQAANAIEYSVSRDISGNKDRQVQILQDRIKSVTSKRLVMAYPGTCNVAGFTDLPGVYLSSAIGGMLSLFEPHRPKNQILLAGINGISTSNLGYFTPKQIDALGDAGYFVLVQDTSDGAPYCVHQSTVAMKDYAETQEFSELSVMNTYDYVSKLLGESLAPFVGTWNITPQAISSIRTTLDAALIRLRSDWTDIIGSPILSYSIKDVSISETSAGTVSVQVEVQLPRVLNTIILNIVSA